MRPTPDEITALPDVKLFVERQFTGCFVIVHASVFWDDRIFTQLTDQHAAQLGVAHNKCVRAELTPDYAVFAWDDVVCAYQKTRKGRPDRRIDKRSDDFRWIADYDKHIPYIYTDTPDFKVPSGRVTAIAIRPGATAQAVIDHKGGAKDFNSATSRRRAILQGRRFGTQHVFMVVREAAEVATGKHPQAVRMASVGQHTFFRLNPADVL